MRIRGGIFQVDSLPQLLFALPVIPMSLVLREKLRQHISWEICGEN